MDGLLVGYLSGHSDKNDTNYAVQENAHLKIKGQMEVGIWYE